MTIYAFDSIRFFSLRKIKWLNKRFFLFSFGSSCSAKLWIIVVEHLNRANQIEYIFESTEQNVRICHLRAPTTSTQALYAICICVLLLRFYERCKQKTTSDYIHKAIPNANDYLRLFVCEDRVVYTEESFILKSKKESNKKRREEKKTNQNLGLKNIFESRGMEVYAYKSI